MLLPLLAFALCAAPDVPPPAEAAAPAAADTPPEHYGTPAGSARAAPRWWDPTRRQLRGQEVVFAPAVSGYRLWASAEAAASKPGALRDAALVCELDYGTTHFDDLAPFASLSTRLGDLSVAAGVEGKRRLVTAARGPDDANGVTFLLPLVSLDPGQAVVVRITDIDFAFDDPVETVRAVYRGRLPLKLPSALRQGRGECRLLPREALEAALAPALASADQALSRVAREFRAEPLAANAKGVDDWLGEPRRRLSDAAGLVGWDDPRVSARVARMAELERRLEDEWGAAFDALRANAIGKEWTLIADDQLEVRAAGTRCGAQLRAYAGAFAFPRAPPADACAVNLGLRNKTDRTLALNGFRAEPVEALRVIDRRGASRSARFQALWAKTRAVDLPSELVLPPGKELELVFFPEREEQILRKGAPLLLALSHHSTVTPRGAKALPLGPAAHLEVADYHCGDPAFEPLAKAAWVFDSRRPLCGLRGRVVNDGEVALLLESLPKPQSVDAAGKARDPEALLVLGEQPRRPQASDVVPAGGSSEVMLLFHGGPEKPEDLRLGIVAAPTVLFVDVSAP